MPSRIIRDCAKSRYRKVYTCLWSDSKYRSLSKPQPNGQFLWLYLLTGDRTTIIPGLIPIGEGGLADALNWPIIGVRKAWKEIAQNEMAQADWSASLIFIPNAIRYNDPSNPNIVIGWHDAWINLPDCGLKGIAYTFLKEYLEGKPKAFVKAFMEACPKPCSIPCRNQDQEQDQDQETGSGTDKEKKYEEKTTHPKLVDEEFLVEQEQSPAYGGAGINVRREFEKCKKWMKVRNRVATKGAFLDWLNRAEPTKYAPGKTRFPGVEKQ